MKTIYISAYLAILSDQIFYTMNTEIKAIIYLKKMFFITA